MFDGIGLQMKTHNKWLKTIGISLLVATIGAAGFTGFMMTHDGGGHSAEATERPNPYTNASIVKIMDGTGWDGDKNNDGIQNDDEKWTPKKGSHTFITKENGFTPGDNAPDDNVVASGDTVRYNVKLTFTAAKQREITVKFDSLWNDSKDDVKYLKLISGGSFCSSNNMVSAKWVDESKPELGCTYSVPAGVSTSVEQKVFLSALDTNGTVKTNNSVKMTVSRKGGSSYTSTSDPITVVSAPNSDLYLDNGADPHNRYGSERYDELSDGNTKDDAYSDGDYTGSFYIKRDNELAYKGWSSLGTTASGAWASPDRPIKIDATAWPASTVFTIGNTKIGNGGKILTYTPTDVMTGEAKLTWSIPASEIGYTCKKPDGVKDDESYTEECSVNENIDSKLSALKSNGSNAYLPIRIIPDKYVFAAGTDEKVMMNQGHGGEPGWDTDRDTSTKSENTGSMRGYPYANNDWSRGIIRRSDTVHTYVPPCNSDTTDCYVFSKKLEQPYANGKTIFDDESKSFDENGSNGHKTFLSGKNIVSSDRGHVSQGTMIRATVSAGIQNSAKNPAPKLFTVSDSWDNAKQVFRGNVHVFMKRNGVYSFTGNNDNTDDYGDGELNTSDYTFQWTASHLNWTGGENKDESIDGNGSIGDTNVSSSSDKTAEWNTGIPAESEWDKITAVRVVLHDGLDYQAGDNYYLQFDLKEIASTANGSLNNVCDVVDGSVNSGASGRSSVCYNVDKVGDPKASITNKLTATRPSFGNKVINNCDAVHGNAESNACITLPGDKATYTIQPYYENIAYSNATITRATVTVKVDPSTGLINASSASKEWTADIKTDNKGNVQGITFTLNIPDDGYVPALDADGNGHFPEIKWTADISNRAIGSITTTSELTYDINKANAEPVYNHNNVGPANESNVMTISAEKNSGGQITAGNTVEVNDSMNWNFNVFTRGSAYAGNDYVQTVVRMPALNDEIMGGSANIGKNTCIYESNGKTEVNTEGIGDNKNNMPGIDCSWHEYDRGSSDYTGGWELTAEPEVKTNNSTDVEFMYAVGNENKNSDNPADYTWKSWNALSDNDKKNINAILIKSHFDKIKDGSETLPVAAANGTITITPVDTDSSPKAYKNANHSGEQYVAWIGRNCLESNGTADCNAGTDGKKGTYENTQPWADVNKVVAGTLSGTLWWDDSNDAYMDDNEQRIPDVKVVLCNKSDIIDGTIDITVGGKQSTMTHKFCGDNHNSKALRTMHTWTADDVENDSTGWKNDYMNTTDADSIVKKAWKGGYKFIELHSGDYVTIVSRADNAGKTDGKDGSIINHAIPTRIDKSQDYYNTERQVANTYSYDSISGCTNGKQPSDGDECERAAHDWSTDANVPAGGDRPNVDYGYYAPHPLAAVNKQVTNTACIGSKCTIQYAISVKNNGNTVIHANNGNTKLVDTMSNEVKDVKSYLSALKKSTAQVFTDGDHSLVLANDKLYSWGYNKYGQVGKASDNGDSVKPSTNALTSIEGKCTSADTGSMHSAAICGDKLYTWGLNDSGQLGNGSHDSTPAAHATPTPVTVTGAGTPVLVAAGADYTVIIDSNGNMFITQSNGSWTQVDTGTKYKTYAGSLSAFSGTIAAIDSDGNAKYTTSATTIYAPSLSSVYGSGFTQVAAGFNHVVALTSTGSIITAGDSDFGQTAKPSDNTGFVSVSAGYMSSAAVKSDGAVWTWGLDLYGNLATGTDSDKIGIAYKNGNQYEVGKNGDTVKDADGNPVYVGKNEKPSPRSSVSMTVDGSNITKNANLIALGFNHSLYSMNSGEVMVAGYDAYSDGANINKNHRADADDGSWNVYKIGNLTPESIGKAKIYGSDYVDTSNMITIDTPEGTDAGTALTKREYSIPYDIPAGNELVFVFEGTVNKNAAIMKADKTYQAGAAKYVVNQAWFTSTETPFDKTPNARTHAGNIVNNGPAAPSETVNDWDATADTGNIANAGHPTGDWNAESESFGSVLKSQGETTDGIARNGTQDVHDATYTCRAGYAFGEVNEHIYGKPFNQYRATTDSAKDAADTVSTIAHNEDQCDQVGVFISGQAHGAIFGTISGRYWIDSNKDGIQQADELSNTDNQKVVAGKVVSLWTVSTDGSLKDKIDEKKVNADGSYEFTDLPIDQNADGSSAKCGEIDSDGTMNACSSLKYRVMFSEIPSYSFTESDVASSNTNAYHDATDDSDVHTDKKDESTYAQSTVEVQWMNVKTDQSHPNIDAGYVLDKVWSSDFPLTGSRLILLLIALIVITGITIWRIRMIDKEQD